MESSSTSADEFVDANSRSDDQRCTEDDQGQLYKLAYEKLESQRHSQIDSAEDGGTGTEEFHGNAREINNFEGNTENTNTESASRASSHENQTEDIGDNNNFRPRSEKETSGIKISSRDDNSHHVDVRDSSRGSDSARLQVVGSADSDASIRDVLENEHNTVVFQESFTDKDPPSENDTRCDACSSTFPNTQHDKDDKSVEKDEICEEHDDLTFISKIDIASGISSLSSLTDNKSNDDDDALDFVHNHFADSSDDEAKAVPDQKVVISQLSDVGRYSYACLIAHSLHTLFGYSITNRKFQEQCLKQVIRRLGRNKKLQKTMMMIVCGDITMDSSDPLVDSLKREFPNPKTGSLAIIEDLLQMALQEGIYDARMRTLLKFISLLLCIGLDELETLEDTVQERFRDEGHEPTAEETKERLDKMKTRKIKRIALVTVAAVGGGALIGLTAGLAAPLIAVGAGAIIGGVGAAGLGTVAGAAIIGSIFGVAGAGLTGYKMKKRIGDLEEFEFEPLTQGRSLHVTVAVSGWLNDKHTDFRSVWLGLANSREQYILRYESKYLRELGNAMEYIANIAIGAAVKHTLKQTLLSGLLAAISWPLTLLSVASIIDNPWSICTQRSVNAGKQMAEVLLSREQGRRPVTLVGFSFGARVIFACLEEMAMRKNSEGIVEDVILLGAPVTGCEEDWKCLEKVVSGRIVNGYCRGDWLLKFMYRTASAQLTIAGLTPVKWENRRMHNVDLTDIVSGHLDYFNQIDTILNAIGIKTVEHAEVGSLESLKQWTSLHRPGNKPSQKNPPKEGLETTLDEVGEEASESTVSSPNDDESQLNAGVGEAEEKPKN